MDFFFIYSFQQYKQQHRHVQQSQQVSYVEYFDIQYSFLIKNLSVNSQIAEQEDKEKMHFDMKNGLYLEGNVKTGVVGIGYQKAVKAVNCTDPKAFYAALDKVFD